MSPRESSQPASRLLMLMRHAKSAYSDASQTDHERPLNDRGRRDTPRMARWLAEQGRLPSLILCSSSTRTRETVRRLIEGWEAEPTLAVTDDLYLASPETILDVIRGDGCDAERLMVVAHNPGISQLASLLRTEALEMPTAAVASFDFEDGDWGRLRSANQVQLRDFMKPKSLGTP